MRKLQEFKGKYLGDGTMYLPHANKPPKLFHVGTGLLVNFNNEPYVISLREAAMVGLVRVRNA